MFFCIHLHVLSLPHSWLTKRAVKLRHRWTSREDLVIEGAIRLVHLDRRHICHIVDHILIENSHFFILCHVFFILYCRLDLVIIYTIKWVLGQIDVVDHLFIRIRRVNIRLSQVRVDSLSSAKLP